MLVHSPAIDLICAVGKVKLPKGIRWARGGLCAKGGVVYGILTRDVKRGVRPVAYVECARKEEAASCVERAAHSLTYELTT